MTRESILEMIDLYLEAEKAVLSGKEVTFEGRVVKLENLSEIRAGRAMWEKRLQEVKSGHFSKVHFV
ncbi:hypothetical protein [Pleionea sediminis]|uniref:hypothetical protein n=1 Tax=Pleionea sediminis TaxID=2569479 RepID=UPI0011853BF2|nr:hypothetical protein [Pleionea sediminis]